MSRPKIAELDAKVKLLIKEGYRLAAMDFLAALLPEGIASKTVNELAICERMADKIDKLYKEFNNL